METRSAKPGDLGGPVVSGLEIRDAVFGTIKVRDIDEAKREVDVEFPHEVVDSYKTKFGTRAFEESFDRKLPVMCWQHDLRDPIGHSLSAVVGPKTNDIVGKFSDFDRVPNAGRAFSQINDGTLTDFSFGFKNASYEPGGQRGVRRIVKAYMAEFSPVTIGSIPGAGAVGLREDGEDEMEYELEQLLQMRKDGILTEKGFGELLVVHFPDFVGKIRVRDTGSTDGLDDDGDDDGDQGEGEVVQWTANKAGFHTATGPNGEAMTANRSGVWSVVDNGGTTIGSGVEDDPEAAKAAANGAVMNRSVKFEWSGPVTADVIREALSFYDTRFDVALQHHFVAIEEIGATRADGESLVDEFAGTLATGLRAAVDNANAYFDEVDVATLPEDVQQGITLVRSAGSAVEVLTDSLGIDYEGTRADDEDDDSDDDSGSSDPCDAAMAAFNDADASGKQAAARKVMSAYGKAKKTVPGSVLKAAMPKKRDDEEDVETRDAEVDAKRAEALARIDRMTAKVKPSDDEAA